MSIFYHQGEMDISPYDPNDLWGETNTLEGRVSEFTDKVSMWMGRMTTDRGSQTQEGTLSFKDAQMRNKAELMGDGVEAGIKSFDKAGGAVASLANESVSTVSGVINRRNRQKETLRRARKAAAIGKEQFGLEFDPSVSYKKTNYERGERSAEDFYKEFDAMIDTKRASVIASLGGDLNYSDLDDDYGEGGISKKDIDNLVMQEMVGMSAASLRQAETWKGIGAKHETYTADYMDTMREYFMQSGMSSQSAINKAADMEDAARKKEAMAIQKGNLASAARRKKAGEQAEAQALDAIRIAEGQSEEAFQKGMSMLTSGGSLGKKRVRSVDFGANRAQ